MGCHTWFSRPLNEEEFQLMTEWAPIEIKELTLDNEQCYDKWLYDLLMRSYNENMPCVYGKYWYELGYGSSNPKFVQMYGDILSIRAIEGKVYVDCSFSADMSLNKYGKNICDFELTTEEEQLNFPYFHDVFRVENYPNKVIHSRKELRKYLRKRYFKLSEYQLKRISKFFQMYPGGVITFG